MLKGKKILVLGVANKMSIAWAITEALHNAGAEIALTYMNEAIERRVRPLADEIGCQNVLPCDVQSDGDLDRLFDELQSRIFESIPQLQ